MEGRDYFEEKTLSLPISLPPEFYRKLLKSFGSSFILMLSDDNFPRFFVSVFSFYSCWSPQKSFIQRSISRKPTGSKLVSVKIQNDMHRTYQAKKTKHGWSYNLKGRAPKSLRSMCNLKLQSASWHTCNRLRVAELAAIPECHPMHDTCKLLEEDIRHTNAKFLDISRKIAIGCSKRPY